MTSELMRKNLATLFLVQASRGLIPFNVRMLSLRFVEDKYLIKFILREDDEAYVEYAIDIAAEFEACFSTSIDVSFQIEVVSGLLIFPDIREEFVIYKEFVPLDGPS